MLEFQKYTEIISSMINNLKITTKMSKACQGLNQSKTTTGT